MQMRLPMLTVYEGPRLVDDTLLGGVTTYRQAVRLCWQERTRRNMSARTLAEEAGLYAPHVSDYLHEQENKRDLPARYIDVFEVACGNRAITQWLARRAQLPVDLSRCRRSA